MNCPKCGAVLPEYAKFCSECGAVLNGDGITVTGPEKGSPRFGRRAWKLWVPIVSVALVTAIVLVSVSFAKSGKVAKSAASEPKMKTVVSQMSGWSGIEYHEWNLDYQEENHKVEVADQITKEAEATGGGEGYDLLLDIAEAFAPSISLKEHPELYLVRGDGKFPSDLVFAFNDLICSGKIKTIHVNTSQKGQNIETNYSFETNEKQQLVRYTKQCSYYGEKQTVNYQYNEQGRLKKITLHVDGEYFDTDCGYLFSYPSNEKIVVTRIGDVSMDESVTTWTGILDSSGFLQSGVIEEGGGAGKTTLEFDVRDSHMNEIRKTTKTGSVTSISRALFQYDKDGMMSSIREKYEVDGEAIPTSYGVEFQYTTLKG